MESEVFFAIAATVTAGIGYLSARDKLGQNRRRRRGTRVTVIGDMACDVIADSVGDIPKWGEEEFVPHGMTLRGGGSGLNTAVWLHALSHGLHVTIPQTFAKRSHDGFTETVLRTIERAALYLIPPNSVPACDTDDIDAQLTCEVERDRVNWATGTSLCMGSDGRRSFITFRGGNGDFELSDFAFTQIVPVRTQHVHIAGYYNCPGLWNEETADFIRACRKAGVKTISLNPQFSKCWGSGIEKLIPLVDFFVCNRTEALGITKETELESAIMTLGTKFQCNCVVVTLGAEGALILRRCLDLRPVRVLCKDILEQPSVDTVGVGDAFCAGFLHEVIAKNLTAESPDVLEAVRYGCACGTAACTVSGGSSFPGLHVIRESLID